MPAPLEFELDLCWVKKDCCRRRHGGSQEGISVAVTPRHTENLSVRKTVRCADAEQWVAR